MEEVERIKIVKDTQKFVKELSELPKPKYEKVMKLLSRLKD
ncbi:MAG: hypothetical protein U9Q99_02985 [Nanoarchaeota archaeon]|nr:hypothetical protein [Nanoarchaeota archaeon]